MSNASNWAYFDQITKPALVAAPRDFLANIRANLVADGIPIAVRHHDTPALVDWLVGISQMQGISDRSAAAFVRNHGIVSSADIEDALSASPPCPLLRSYWSFNGCNYRKTECSCSHPEHIDRCSLPTHPARKGTLIGGAYALHLFARDLCEGDLIGWIDARLKQADPGFSAPHRAQIMGSALIQPLRHIFGFGEKLVSMALADLLLAADPRRERWTTTGAGFVVIDSLLHNYLHRTGLLHRFDAEHPYGPRCYGPGGCSDLLRAFSRRIDARQFNRSFPADFPRFVQFSLWRFCSTSELNICNGVRIDDRARCQNVGCPVFNDCDRVALDPA